MTRIVGEEQYEPEVRRRSVRNVPFFIRDDLIDIITDHGDEGLLQDSEIMGLIVGKVYKDDDGEYAVATGIISSELDADDVSVRFDQTDMTQLIDEIDNLKEGDRIVGWYHSHLGCGCFMSDTDIKTQNGLFGGRIGFAMVIDPVLRQLKVFDSTMDDPQPIQMIVME
jgi:proteasome lid subunit RPN8/RPN11